MTKNASRDGWSVLAASGLLLAGFLAWSPEARTAPSAEPKAVERGRHLVKIMGCHDCHTPKKMGPQGPEPDMSRALSGHPEADVMPDPPKPVGPWIASAAWDLTAWSG